MKKLYSLLIVVLLAFAAKSQTTSHWTGSVNTDWQVVGNWDNGVPNANTIIASFNTGTTLSVTNTPTATIGGLVVASNTNVTVTGTAARTLTIANNTGTDLMINTGSQFTMGTNVNVTLATSATATIDGTLTVSTGRTYNTNGTTVLTTVSGTIDNSGTVTSAAAKLSFASGSTYIHSQNGGTIPTATWNAASTIQVTGTVATFPTGFDTQTLGNVIWNCPSQAVANTPAALTIAGNLTVQNTGTGEFRFGSPGTNAISGGYSQTGGSVRIGSATARTVTVSGSVSVSGGTLSMSTGTAIGTLNVAGNFSISGGTVTETSTGSGAINFNGASTQVYSKTGGSFVNTINFTINAGAIVDFGTSLLDGSAGSFTLSSTGKIITANSGGVPSTIQVTGTKTYNSGADYEFGGSSTGAFTTTPTAATVRNLIVNNGSGNVTLAQPLAVTGTLTLTNGALTTTATNIVTINSGAGTSGGSNTSFVNGPIAKVGNTAFTFPVGKSGAGLHAVGITALSASSTITAEYFRSDPHTLSSTYGGSIIQISGCEYWTMNRTGAGTGRSVLSWESTSTCNGASYVGNLSTLRVARLNAGTWADDGTFSTTGSTSSGTITSNNNATTFSSSFAIATSAVDNPLPVMFADVRAYQKNNGVQIEWSNLTERDLVNYTVERSADGQNYTTLALLLPRSNNNDKEMYSSFDAAPLAGVNFYRIKVLEISGKLIYSKTLKIDITGAQQAFTLYPNPVTGNQVSLSINVKQGQYSVKVLNANGQQVFSKRFAHPGGFLTQTIELPSSVKPGVYNMVMSGGDYHESKMFIVQ